MLGEEQRSKDPKLPRILELSANLRASRGADGTPADAEPVVTPAPPVAAPAEVERITAAARAAQNSAIEEDVGRIIIGLLLPVGRDEMLILQQGEEDGGIEAGVGGLCEAFQTLLTTRVLLLFLEAGFEENLRQVQFGESERASVLLFFAFETIAVSGTAPDTPIFAEELGGIEGGGAVDAEDG